MKTSNKMLLAVLVAPVLLVLILTVSLRIAFERSPRQDGETTDFGPMVSRIYDYRNFKEIVIMGPWNIDLVQGNEYRVEIGAQKKILNLAGIDKTGSTLTLSYLSIFRGGSMAEPLRAVIVLPSVSDVNIAGACRVRLRGFYENWLRISARGEISVSATDMGIKNLEIRGDGITSMNLSEVPVVNAKIEYNGDYSISLLMAGGRLAGVIGGIGSLVYSGDADISQLRTDSAMGRIIHTGAH